MTESAEQTFTPSEQAQSFDYSKYGDGNFQIETVGAKSEFVVPPVIHNDLNIPVITSDDMGVYPDTGSECVAGAKGQLSQIAALGYPDSKTKDS